MYNHRSKMVLTDDFSEYMLLCTKLGATSSDGGGLRIGDKKTYYRLASNRLLGNSLRTWGSPESVDCQSGVFGLRSTGKGGGRFVGPYSLEHILATYQQWSLAGYDMTSVLISEGFERGIVQIQGEIQNSIRGIDLSFSTQNDLTCREAMRAPNSVSGSVAWKLLRSHMSGLALDTLEFLLTAYPESVIEFSTTSKSLGWANDPTVFWEVRNY